MPATRQNMRGSVEMADATPVLYASDPLARLLESRFSDLEEAMRRLERKIDKITQPRITQQRLAHISALPKLAEIKALVVSKMNNGYEIPEGRERPHVRMRQIFMLLARDFGYSYPLIGRALKRDHTTVIHGEYVINAVMQDEGLEPLITEMRKELKAAIK